MQAVALETELVVQALLQLTAKLAQPTRTTDSVSSLSWDQIQFHCHGTKSNLTVMGPNPISLSWDQIQFPCHGTKSNFIYVRLTK